MADFHGMCKALEGKLNDIAREIKEKDIRTTEEKLVEKILDIELEIYKSKNLVFEQIDFADIPRDIRLRYPDPMAYIKEEQDRIIKKQQINIDRLKENLEIYKKQYIFLRDKRKELLKGE